MRDYFEKSERDVGWKTEKENPMRTDIKDVKEIWKTSRKEKKDKEKKLILTADNEIKRKKGGKI